MPERLNRGSILVVAACLLLAGGFAGANAVPDRVTYTKDVAPIFFEHCVACHRPGEIAPMSLRNYDETRPWAKSIQEKTQSGEMPPWFADEKHGEWLNETRLSEVEMATISRWVDLGAPRGDMKDMPALPEFTQGWEMGEPDFIIDLPEVNVPATGPDYFPNLSFTADVPEDKWVRAIEIRPSNRLVAHHVVIFMNGFGGGGGMSGGFDVLGVWSVGTGANVYPEGMGRKISSGQRFTTNMHYHPNGEAATDQTKIGLYFGEGELENEVTAAIAGSYSFWIPAGEGNHEEVSSWYVDSDIKIVSFFPHMHMRGKDMSFTAVYPDGQEKTLLSVPKYDFDWQLFYYPDEPVTLPAGSRIDILAHYDNSPENPSNPNADIGVGFGLQSTDEMMFGVFEYVYDEGVASSDLTEADRVAMVAASFPEGEAYNVSFKLGANSLPSVLHLPREGDGQWVVWMGGAQMALPVSDVKWVGDQFSFTLTLRFGEMGGDLDVTGQLDAAGGVAGKLSGSGDPMLAMLNQDFEGEAAAD